ncbi:uncharacterized protein LOC144869289 [Branchiostoma floridae x Branchiostoma japonicum]
MAPVLSRPETESAFPAEQMIGLLRQMDESVRQVVRCMREQGTEVRQKVGDLLQKYLTLLTETLHECMYLKNFVQITRGNLGGIESILTLALDGTVSEIMEELHLQHFQVNFERKDLRSAYQLMTSSFDVEDVDLPTKAAKEAVQDRVQEFRHELHTAKDRIHQVRVDGESCHTSCKAITEKFGKFLQEIKKTHEAISSLLVQHRNDKSEICLASIAVFAISAICLVACGVGAVAVCCKTFTTATNVKLGGVAGLSFSSGVTGVVSGMTAWGLHQKKKEMDSVGTALEKLQKQLEAMDFDAGKQKTDWEKIESQAEKIVHYIDNSKMEATADGLNPSHRRPVQDLMNNVKDVLKDAEDLQTKLDHFETEAEQVQRNLRDLSLINSDAVLANPTATASASLLDPLYNFAIDITKTVMKWTRGLDKP